MASSVARSSLFSPRGSLSLILYLPTLLIRWFTIYARSDSSTLCVMSARGCRLRIGRGLRLARHAHLALAVRLHVLPQIALLLNFLLLVSAQTVDTSRAVLCDHVSDQDGLRGVMDFDAGAADLAHALHRGTVADDPVLKNLRLRLALDAHAAAGVQAYAVADQDGVRVARHLHTGRLRAGNLHPLHLNVRVRQKQPHVERGGFVALDPEADEPPPSNVLGYDDDET